jgi:hypothetical protein
VPDMADMLRKIDIFSDVPAETTLSVLAEVWWLGKVVFLSRSPARGLTAPLPLFFAILP